MRLCNEKENPRDSLERLAAVAAFLGEALCGAREIPWQDDAELWGAQMVFDALVSDIMTIRSLIK